MILQGITPHRLTARQMANATYALLVRDMASGIDRSRLDGILAGQIMLPTQVEMDNYTQDRTADRIQPLPNPRDPKTGKLDMDKLREQWGASESAKQSKLQFDQMMKGLPGMGPG